MKSARYGGILKGILQALHVHVLLVAPLAAGHMTKPGADQHEDGITVRESPHHSCTTANLPAQSFNDVVCYPLSNGSCCSFILPEVCIPCLLLSAFHFAKPILQACLSKKERREGEVEASGFPAPRGNPPPLRKGAGDLGKTQEKITDICNATPGPCNRRRGCVPGSRRCRSPLRPGGTAPPCWCSIPLGCRWGWPGR